MKAQITIDTKTALLAGLNHHGSYDISFEPSEFTPEQRAELAHTFNSKDNLFQINQTCYFGNFEQYLNNTKLTLPLLDAPTIQNMKLIINLRIKFRKGFDIYQSEQDLIKETKKQTELDQKKKSVLKLISNGTDVNAALYRQLRFASVEYSLKSDLSYDFNFEQFCTENNLQEYYEDVESAIFWLNLDTKVSDIHNLKKRKLLELEAEENANLLKIKQRHQIEEYVVKSGTKSQKERFEEDMLPEKEIIDIIRNLAFSHIEHNKQFFFSIRKFKKLRKRDICDCWEEYNYDFISDDLEKLTKDQWNIRKDLLAFIGKTDIFTDPIEIDVTLHKGNCSVCNSKLTKISYRVAVTVGYFSFSRRYEIV